MLLNLSFVLLLACYFFLIRGVTPLSNDYDAISPYATMPVSSLTPEAESSLITQLQAVKIRGKLVYPRDETPHLDYGRMCNNQPLAVLYPDVASDIALIVKFVNRLGPFYNLTVTAKGCGHSLMCQSQSPNGILVEMQALRDPDPVIETDGPNPYIQVSGGMRWSELLNITLPFNFSAQSWTDYLELTIGGTLSNAGISGQTFRFGPEISNVYSLEVVTGLGEIVTCSPATNSDLFYAVLGGLGQMGIITGAKIALGPAPQRVILMQALYTDFPEFCADQELLISSQDTFDYVEGFVYLNRTGAIPGSNASNFYRLEVAKYYNVDKKEEANKSVNRLLSGLRYVNSTLKFGDASYLEFLQRVYLTAEIPLREHELWEVPHPWINVMIPQSKIQIYANMCLGGLVTTNGNNPTIIYPVNRNKWNTNTSAVFPSEDVFYTTSILWAVPPSPTQAQEVQQLLALDQKIVNNIMHFGGNAYLAHFHNQSQWKEHFGPQRWSIFCGRKLQYDPNAILAPLQRIFPIWERVTCDEIPTLPPI